MVLNSPIQGSSPNNLKEGKTPLVTLSPAFRWAQSLDETIIEVKFATRLDSPACIDLYDKTIEIVEDPVSKNHTLRLEATCVNDQKLIQYSLAIDLYDKVAPFSKDIDEKQS